MLNRIDLFAALCAVWFPNAYSVAQTVKPQPAPVVFADAKDGNSYQVAMSSSGRLTVTPTTLQPTAASSLVVQSPGASQGLRLSFQNGRLVTTVVSGAPYSGPVLIKADPTGHLALYAK